MTLPLDDGALSLRASCPSCSMYVCPVICEFSLAYKFLIDLVSGLKFYQGELHHVSAFQVCRMSTSCLLQWGILVPLTHSSEQVIFTNVYTS